jgi:gluconokinase/xylulokinase
MLALGVTGPGDVAYVTGSSSVIVGLSRDLVLDAGHRYLVTPLVLADGWGLEMDLLTTGSAVNWLARLVRLGRRGEAGVMELAATADDDAGGVRFVPSLGPGEQGALWDPELRGTLLGLSLAHGPAEIARALVEGILFESRRCLDVLAQNGLPPAPIRLAGAGGSSPFFRQCLADLSGREVLYAVDDERPFSALGAALVAAEATGAAPQDPGAWAGPMHRTAPNPARRAHWEARWREQRELVAGLQHLYRAK